MLEFILIHLPEPLINKIKNNEENYLLKFPKLTNLNIYTSKIYDIDLL
jgi:hypothetical protein